MNSHEHLRNLQRLLKMEKDEDREYYKTKVLAADIGTRRKLGQCWYPLAITEISCSKTGRVIAELERTTHLDDAHQFQFGKAVSLFTNRSSFIKDNPQINGVISVVRQNKIVINFNADELPDWIEEGKLGIDLMFDEISYREMERALERVIDADKESRLYELREILLGNQQAHFGKAMFPLSGNGLNQSQNEAIENIIRAEDVALIHGPPGTGKTTTLVEAIVQLSNHESQILVCAPSNTAIDLISEKLSLRGITVVRLGNPARISEALFELTLDSRMSRHPNYRDMKQLKKDAAEYRRMASKYKRNFGPSEREQRRMIVDEAKKREREAGHLEFYMQEEIIATAKVIATTLVGAGHNILREKKFATLFIDEAGQALEPACWIPIQKAQRVIFAGDHHQLPPTVKSLKAAREGLSITLFEQIIQHQKADIMLRTQYRMHEQIMQFSSDTFYEGALEASDLVRHRNIFGLDLPPVEFIDTAGASYDEKQESERSLTNPEEAAVLVRHLESFTAQLESELTEEQLSTLKIGVISPYKAQVLLLKDLLKDLPILITYPRMLAINTVDGFQGQERDAIYISLVRSNERQEIGFLSDYRRMNVALTRAKSRLIIIGDSATIGAHKFYSDMIEYFESIGAYRSVWEYNS